MCCLPLWYKLKCLNNYWINVMTFYTICGALTVICHSLFSGSICLTIRKRTELKVLLDVKHVFTLPTGLSKSLTTLYSSLF